LGEDALEKVRLRVEVGSAELGRVTRATRRGSFRVVFRGVGLDRCHVLRVMAVGARGDHASFTLQPLECPTGEDD
jgi:hypothetical protein